MITALKGWSTLPTRNTVACGPKAADGGELNAGRCAVGMTRREVEISKIGGVLPKSREAEEERVLDVAAMKRIISEVLGKVEIMNQSSSSMGRGFASSASKTAIWVTS
ncbi:MAG TPA: hypothetical protein VEO53_05455 [Candidatus Binatia bacterium]|nr:hypothetical protein [Candidatus Binatia bacterium]